MISNKLHSIVISAAFLCLGAAPLFGQAVFSVGSTAAAVADIGVTELTGQIVLTVSSGTTVPAPLTITYSAQITNNAASEITITGTGGLGGVAGAPILLAASNAIIINVPTGGMAGDYIRIQGVRVSVAGQNFTGVTATVQALSSSGNGIVVGQNTVVVAGQVLKPLLMDLSQAPPLSFTFGATVDVSSFIIKEGFSSAFSSSIGQFGQTVPTRIRITPFPSIPAGIQVTFPASVSSTQTGAILATTSGQSETVPRADGSTEVIYEFSEAPSSSLEVESFTVPVSMTIDAAAAMGIINFQATLIPIGLATPNTAFPSTDIPRYVERKVPDETELSIGTIELAFPFRAQAAATYTGIALTNPTGFRVNATFTAYGADGSVITGAGINNPVVLTLPRNGQVAKLTKDIFGAGFSASTAGTIRVQGKSPQVAGFYLLGDLQGPRLDGAIGDLNSVQGWVWPVVFRRIPAPFTTFEIFNPGTVQANAVLTLFDAGGRIVKTASQSIAVSGTVNREFGELFPGVDLNSFSGGYIKGQSDVGVVVRETFGNSRDSNVVPGQIPIQRTAFYLPHFASGGGYTSELNLVNTDPSMKADIAVTLLDNNGLPLGSSVNLSILPGTQFIQTVASLFATRHF